MKIQKCIEDKLLIGRDEWVSLPDLSLPMIKAKIDTGAKTSAIHAFNISQKKHRGVDTVFFEVHPLQGNNEIKIHCQSPITDQRIVMSSNGHKENRYVISSKLNIAGVSWPIEITLSNRDPLKYRLLLGREALKKYVLIDPHLSCHQTKMTTKKSLNFYGFAASTHGR